MMSLSRSELLKKLLPGFIPLFVFIAADELWGTKTGLLVAIATGVVQMSWIGIKEKRFDKFVLFDTLLLVALGGVSILFHNDLFFKLKPGLIELILVGILAVAAFSKLNLPQLMAQRYMKGVEINPQQQLQMRNTMKTLFFVFAAHTILVFYATFYLSKEAWAFISGGLFYVLFAIVFAWTFFKQKIKQRKLAKEEWVPLVDDQGKIIGTASRSEVHNGSKLLHPVVHMHVINENKSILLQKRPLSKQIQPGKWDTSVGGHISAGENLQQALVKEACEEIGLKGFNSKLLHVYKWESEVETELVYLFVTYDAKNFSVVSDEVAEVKFWSRAEITKSLGQEVFTPNFEYEFHFLQQQGL